MLNLWACKSVAPGRPGLRACKWEHQMRMGSLPAFPFAYPCPFLARHWGRDGPVLLTAIQLSNARVIEHVSTHTDTA